VIIASILVIPEFCFCLYLFYFYAVTRSCYWSVWQTVPFVRVIYADNNHCGMVSVCLYLATTIQAVGPLCVKLYNIST